ncbi:hypothetical protein J6590_016491 [Homalodisca vitripennis]|nr:hypothetical protein J6590_016491 [Homalodisca vitripennis]
MKISKRKEIVIIINQLLVIPNDVKANCNPLNQQRTDECPKDEKRRKLRGAGHDRISHGSSSARLLGRYATAPLRRATIHPPSLG